MTLAVQLRPEAEQELSDAAAWCEEQRQCLGNEFMDEILNIILKIADTPTYPNLYQNTRRAIVQRFPFGIYSRVEEDMLVVIAVMHGSRNRRRWKTGTN